MNKKVTVIIPTYNRENELKVCLDALSNQTYKNYEIIVIDDGSTDGTKKLVKTYKNIKYIYQNNYGPAKARNKGIISATGEILAFTDDDCIPEKDWLKNAVPYFNNPSIIGVEGITMSSDLYSTPTSIATINLHGKKYSTCNMFYRAEVFKEVGMFDEKFKSAWEEEYELACRILKKGEIKFVDSVKVYHPIRYYNIKSFLKMYFNRKTTYWQVLSRRFTWDILIFCPLYIALLYFILDFSIISLIILIYAYSLTFLLHNLYITKGRFVDFVKYKFILIKLFFIYWVIILYDTFYRVWGMIKFRRIIL